MLLKSIICGYFCISFMRNWWKKNYQLYNKKLVKKFKAYSKWHVLPCRGQIFGQDYQIQSMRNIYIWKWFLRNPAWSNLPHPSILLKISAGAAAVFHYSHPVFPQHRSSSQWLCHFFRLATNLCLSPVPIIMQIR